MQNQTVGNLLKHIQSGKLTDEDLSEVLGKLPSVKDIEIKNKLDALKNFNKKRIDDDNVHDDNNDDDDDFKYLPSAPIPYFPDSPCISGTDNEDNDNFNDYVTRTTH